MKDEWAWEGENWKDVCPKSIWTGTDQMNSTDSFWTKKDSTLRLWVDCRWLIALSKRDYYPVSRLDEGLDYLDRIEVFSTFDANSRYWKVEIGEKNGNMKTSSLKNELYRFLRVPFRQSNALGTFQLIMEAAVTTLKWQICLQIRSKSCDLLQITRRTHRLCPQILGTSAWCRQNLEIEEMKTHPRHDWISWSLHKLNATRYSDKNDECYPWTLTADKLFLN